MRLAEHFARIVLTATLICAATGSAWAGQAAEVREFGPNPGALRMFRYVPPDLPAGAPLVVALHGCKQTASGYGEAAGWIGLAERMRFALLLPEQQQANNAQNCFNWFQPEDIAPGQGEAASIRAMVDKMKADYGSGAVYAAGLSAGGAMAVAILADYPQLFAGGGAVAGLPYRCAGGVFEAMFQCMSAGKNLSPQQWADLVRQASGAAGPWPRLSIWQGGKDQRVTPSNMTELMEQWTNVHGIAPVPAIEDSLNGYPRKIYKDAAGRAVVETVFLPDMAHVQPIAPGTAEDGCGQPAAYIEDWQICAAYHIAKFWGLGNSAR